MKIARAWVEDCAVDHDDQLEREQATDDEITKWVDKNYSGGLSAFLESITEEELNR